MVKVGDTVKWDAGKQGMLSGKVTGGEKGKFWKIEKGGKRYYVQKDKVKKGVVKKPRPVPKKEEPKKKTPDKKQYTFTVYLPTDYSNSEALDYYEDRPSDITYTEDFELPKILKTVTRRELGTNNTYHRFVSKKTYGGIAEFRKSFPEAPTKYTNDWGDNYGYTGGIVKTLSK